jgi:hypothetical protein
MQVEKEEHAVVTVVGCFNMINKCLHTTTNPEVVNCAMGRCSMLVMNDFSCETSMKLKL